MRNLKKSVIICLILTVVLIFMPGCSSNGRNEESAPDYQPVVTEEAGVKVLLNPEYPKEGTFVLELTEELSLGEEGEGDMAVLNRPQDVRAGADGTIYVLDWGDIQIKVYDENGHFVRTIGRKGQGPGEFDAPCYFDIAPDGRLCLLDSRSRRIEIFNPSGDLADDFRLEGFNSRIRCDGQGWMYFAKETMDEEEQVLNTWQEIPVLTSIFKVGEEGGDPFLLGDFPGKVQRIMKTGENSSMSVGSLFEIFWLVGGDGRLYTGYNKDYRLGVYSPEGELLFRFGREFEPVANPRYKAGRGERYMPAFHWASVFDEEGNLWLNLYDEDEEYVTYDIFSPDGIYLRQVKSPVRIFFFKNQRIYSIIRPEDGFYSVKRFAYSYSDQR